MNVVLLWCLATAERRTGPPLRKVLDVRKASTVTGSPSQGDHPPIYEDLVRERGDVVADAQSAAEHAQHQAAQLLGRHPLDQPHPLGVTHETRGAL